LFVVVVAPVSGIVTMISEQVPYLFNPNLSRQKPAIFPNLLNELAANETGDPDGTEAMAEIVYVPGGSVPRVREDDAIP